MIAAIYPRKSTEQNGVADEQKSIARQIDHARQYAARKGWTVDESAIFVDDGISGAEFAGRPGFVRLMNALKPRAPFQVLVMSEESRLGREAIETAYALKQLVTAGVRVFFYLEDRERTLDSPSDKIMMSLTAFADELEGEKARQRTYDAMQRKAKAGHVTGGRTFGYSNVDCPGPDGKRAYVTREINPVEAAVVRRIFDLYRRGYGLRHITLTLNAEHAPSPRAQQGRPNAWAPSSVREVLYRSLYKGEIVWNKTRKRNPWGQVQAADRPAGDWIAVPAPECRIVSEEVWTEVHDRLRESQTRYLRSTKGRLWGRPGRDSESKYLPPGLARCASCGGGLYVKRKLHGSIGKRRPVYFYGCTSFHTRGASVCQNSLEVRMDASDRAVLDAIERDVLQPAVIAAAVRKAVDRLTTSADVTDDQRVALEQRIATATRDLERLTAAILAGGEASTLVDAIRQRETDRAAARRDLAALDQLVRATTVDPIAMERELRTKLEEWRDLLRRHIPQAHQVLKKLLVAPLQFVAHRDGDERYYEFTAKIALGRVFNGIGGAIRLASPISAS
jgi:site-specific DNA recombinase